MLTVSRNHRVTQLAPDMAPVAGVEPGETFRVETAWPRGIGMRSLADPRPPRRLAITGPIAVRGAHPGDALRVTIHDIALPSWGKVWTAPWLGVLKDAELYERRLDIAGGRVDFAPGLSLPVRPMVGFVGVAPGSGSVECLAPGEHGGNMDCLTIGAGATVVLPVRVDDALLAIGDVHATMGEGEVIGISLEVGAEVTAAVEVARGAAPPCPMVETAAHVAVLITEPEFAAASERAVRTMAELLAARRRLAFADAYALVGLAGDLRICQNINPFGLTLRLEVSREVWGAA